MLRNFFEELKARNVRKTLAIYLGSALTAIGVIKLFAETYGLSTSFMPIVVTLLTCGLGSAFVFAWFHGRTGEQKFQKKEILLHMLIGVVAVGISFVAGRIPPHERSRLPGRSIAVLPFENASNNKADEYFTDGIMEDILMQLSKIGELRVMSRSSVMKYKGQTINAAEVGAELGVAAILEGTVLRDGNRVRIYPKLTDSHTKEILWAERYEREMKDIFAIQSEVATAIAKGLKATLSPHEQTLIQKQPTQNLEAYALFLRGRDYRNRKNREDNERAIELLRKAIALDPHYALAHSELGYAYISKYLSYGSGSEWADSGIALARQAIALDPDNADGYHTVGKGFESQGRLSQALQYYNKAIALSPSYAPAVGSFGWIAFGVGKLDEALEWLKKSVVLAPDFPSRYVNVATMYMYLNEDSLAQIWFQKALELQNDLLVAHWSLVYFHLNNQDIDKARAAANTALKQYPNEGSLLHAAGDVELTEGKIEAARDYYAQSVAGSSLQDGPGNQLAFTLLKLGKKEEAMRILDSNLVYYKQQSAALSEDFYNPLAVAMIYSVKNIPEQAVSWLQIAVQRGCRDYRWFRVEPLLANLRNNREFDALMENLRRQIASMQQRAREKGLFE